MRKRANRLRVKSEHARVEDASDIVILRAAVAGRLSAQYGQGPWSGISTEKGVRFDLRNSTVFVVRQRGKLIATWRLATKKPWAIDRSYFTAVRRPLYLLSMAVIPDLQRQGIGRQCVEEISRIGRQWPADAIRLDAYDAPAGTGPFYEKCGFKDVGRVTFRGCPLAYFEMLL
jgi:GNAT superfamily N-acetyltransferase